LKQPFFGLSLAVIMRWHPLLACAEIRSSVVGRVEGNKVGRTIGRLTALAVTKARTKGMYPDGGGLYLHVSANGAKSWIYRFMLDKRPREMGLSKILTVGPHMA
jgi:hypothetical protein